MSTAAPTGLITAEQFAEMSFDGPVELVRGEIVEMTRPDKPHGSVCGRVALPLMQWAYPSSKGEVVTNDACVFTERSPDTVRGPDVAFYSSQQLGGQKLRPHQDELVPVLCIEVLSPSNHWGEMRAKIDEYFAAGVREVWIVDPQSRTVDVCRNGIQHVLHRSHQNLTSRELPGFEFPVSDFFAGIE